MKSNVDEKILKSGGYPTVDIFWTGGFDSTFRIVQLSRREVFIQPYYISDNRKSESYELAAIENITKELKQNEKTKCVFLELKIISFSERNEKEYISEAYEQLRENEFFGIQYKWLACFAEKHKGIELSIHQDDKAILLINKYGALKKIVDENIGDYFVIDENISDPRIITLFKNCHLPLAKFTKLEMKKFYVDNGYEKIMELTWFCHKPINGKPCGICNPCVYTIEEGLKERFTKTALIRYHCRKIIQKSGLDKLARKIIK